MSDIESFINAANVVVNKPDTTELKEFIRESEEDFERQGKEQIPDHELLSKPFTI